MPRRKNRRAHDAWGHHKISRQPIWLTGDLVNGKRWAAKGASSFSR